MRFFTLSIFSILFAFIHSYPDISGYAERMDCKSSDYQRFEPNVCRLISTFETKAETIQLYAAENRLSLSRPHILSIMLYQVEDTWTLEAFLARRHWSPEKPETFITDTRHLVTDVPDARIELFRQALHDAGLAKLNLEHGKENRICLDGARLVATMIVDGELSNFKRHSCGDRNDIDAFAEVLMSLAIELDPSLASYVDTMTLP